MFEHEAPTPHLFFCGESEVFEIVNFLKAEKWTLLHLKYNSLLPNFLMI